jgi:hypothetical protein
MKKSFIIFSFIFCFNIFSFSINNRDSLKVVINEDTLSGSSILRSVADSFKPNQLNLTNSIIENVSLNNFLSTEDKIRIKSDKDFNYFISMVLLKQYEFHIIKYHQGFDLFTMRAGNAGFIVNSFIELSHLPEVTKGINSSYILEYIANDESLKNDSSISEIINRISSLSN